MTRISANTTIEDTNKPAINTKIAVKIFFLPTENKEVNQLKLLLLAVFSQKVITFIGNWFVF